MSRKWTDTEIDYLKANYPNTRTKDVAKYLGRTELSINEKAFTLKIKKTPEFIRLMLESGKEHRFTKNHIPFNKGANWSKYMPKESAEKALQTCFKKGDEPHNTKHDGYITIRKDKSKTDYQFIRVDKCNWVPLHVHVWKQHNGQIPKGYIVVFKNRNTMDCQIENLELISRAENMKRNTIHRYPKELKQTIRLLSNVKSKLKSSESNAV